jgi:hypothetical protein
MVGQRKIGAHDQFMSLEVKIPSYLPNPSLIIEPAKTAYMISISFRAFVGRMISGAHF